MKPADPILPTNRPSPPPLGYVLAIGMLMLTAAAKPVLIDSLDPDCFWHLRVAQSLLQHGIGPIVDDLCFATVKEPWTPYSWLAELAMLGVWNTFGWRGTVAVDALMSAAVVGLIAACCRQMHRIAADGDARPGYLNTVVATAAACVWSLAYLSFRPATLAIVLLALAAWIILRDRRHDGRSRAVWWCLPLTILLVNVHLTAILIPLWLAALAAGAVWDRLRVADRSDREPTRRILHYSILTGLCGLALLATPMLSGMLKMFTFLQSDDVMVASPIIGEMLPFYHGSFGKVSLVLVILTIGCAIWKRSRLGSGERFWFTGMIAFLLRLGRFSPLFAIIAAPVASVTSSRLSDGPLRSRPVAVLFAFIIAAGVVRIAIHFPTSSTSMDVWMNRNIAYSNGYPTGAADYVDAKIPPRSGRMINEFNWGGYLAWRFAGRFQTLLDGRTQMHPPGFWQSAYLGDAESRASIVRDVNADVAILPKRGSVFADALRSMGWTTAWEDADSEVLIPPVRN